MTTQQKISWYLDKGFAVEVEWDCGTKVIFYAYILDDDGDFHVIGKYSNGFNKGVGDWEGWQFDKDIKSITPIPPKPYEFKVGERVMLDGGEIKTIEKVLSGKDYNYSDKMIYADGWYRTTDNDEYPWYQLAPALPEDEEYEVVEVNNDIELKNCTGDLICKLSDSFDHLIFTKPDGKKLKIRVIKQ